MKRSGRILLIVITAVIALAVIFAANLFTKDKVSANEEQKLADAFAAVYPDADSYDEASYRQDYLTRYLAENGGYTDDQVYVNKVTYARNALRDVQGLVIQVSSYKKFGGIISMLVGIQNDGTVNGYSILKISDAKGLDMKVKDPDFSDQFVGKKVDSFTLVNFNAELPEQIVMANGAEDASQAVVRAVNAAILTSSFIDESVGGLLR